MQAQVVVAYFHFVRFQGDVLKGGRVGLGQGKILFNNSRFGVRSDYFLIGELLQADKPAFPHDAGELPDRIHEFRYRFLVLNLFGNDETPAQRVEVTLGTAPLFRCFRQEQVAVVIEVRSFVEMPLE